MQQPIGITPKYYPRRANEKNSDVHSADRAFILPAAATTAGSGAAAPAAAAAAQCQHIQQQQQH
jgi:hypothetical protein